MRTTFRNGAGGGFTLLELFLLICILIVLAFFWLPFRGQRQGTIVPCMSNLRQVSIAAAMFAEDHSGNFPQQCSITNDGSLELISANNAAVHFRTLSPYLRYSAAWVCPADKARTAASNFLAISNANLSYFINLDATRVLTNGIIAGDRNLESRGRAVRAGLLVLTTNYTVTWTSEMHSKGAGFRCGNLAFVDGHAQNVRKDLTSVIQRQGIATSRFVIP